MITEDYVSLETAKLLKEKGFDGNCHNSYLDGVLFDSSFNKDGFVKAPTLQMAMKWLREKEIFVEVTHTLFSLPHKYQYSIFRTEPEFYTTGDNHKSYEEACETAIKYCLENLI